MLFVTHFITHNEYFVRSDTTKILAIPYAKAVQIVNAKCIAIIGCKFVDQWVNVMSLYPGNINWAVSLRFSHTR